MDNLSDANKKLNTFLEVRDEIVKSVVQKMCELGFVSPLEGPPGYRPMKDVVAERVREHFTEAFCDIEKSLRLKIKIEVGDLILAESRNPENKDIFELAFRNIERAKQDRDKESS